MGEHLLVGEVDFRLIATGVGYAGENVVRDHQGGHPLEVGEGPDVRTRPVGETLRPGGLGKGVIRGAEDGHEDLSVTDLTRLF